MHRLCLADVGKGDFEGFLYGNAGVMPNGLYRRASQNISLRSSLMLPEPGFAAFDIESEVALDVISVARPRT